MTRMNALDKYGQTWTMWFPPSDGPAPYWYRCCIHCDKVFKNSAYPGGPAKNTNDSYGIKVHRRGTGGDWVRTYCKGCGPRFFEHVMDGSEDPQAKLAKLKFFSHR